MSRSVIRRRIRRPAIREATTFKKDNQQDQPFFGETAHEPFFKPAVVMPQALTLQRMAVGKEEEKVQKAPDKKEEDQVHRLPEKKEEEKVQRTAEKRGEEKVQKKDNAAAGTASANTTAGYIGSINGKGQPLSPTLQSFYGKRIGADFSEVKIHTGPEAAESAKGINAQAYTYGNHVVFNEGKYQPETGEGKHLLAHELTHVVQQQLPHIQRKVDEDAIPPLWDKVNGEYVSLIVELGLINQKIPTVERSDLIAELEQYWRLAGAPGEKSDEYLAKLDKTFLQLKGKIERLNIGAHKEWGSLIKRESAETKKLKISIDDPVSVRAKVILDKEFTETFKRVVKAEYYLVSEDLMPLAYMLNNNKHMKIAALDIGRKKHDRGELAKVNDEEQFLDGVGHISVSVGSTMTTEAGLRELYQKGAAEITKDALKAVKDGVPVENAARWANQARNDLKVLIRSKGSSIVKGFAEARNIRKYGNAIGPAYEELIKKGKTPIDIIGSSGKSSMKVNKGLSKFKLGGGS